MRQGPFYLGDDSDLIPRGESSIRMYFTSISIALSFVCVTYTSGFFVISCETVPDDLLSHEISFRSPAPGFFFS